MVDISEFVFDCKPEVSDIKLLADIVFGQDYLTESRIEEYLSNPNYIITTLCHKDRFIGVSFLLNTTLAALDERVVELITEKFHWKKEQPIILHHQTFLAEAYQGLGLGKALVLHSEKKAAKENLPQVSVVWQYTGNKLHTLLKQLGYKEAGIIPKYWHKDSLDKKYSCSICGTPCNCDALILVKPQQR